MTITLTIGSTSVTTLSPCLNVGLYIQIITFGVTFINKFERGDWGLDLRVGLIIMIEEIDLIPISLCFIATHTIRSFMQRESLEVIHTIEMILTSIYGRPAKAFVLVVVDGWEIVNMHALTIFSEFYVQYVKLVEMYATRRLATILIKNIGTPIFIVNNL